MMEPLVSGSESDCAETNCIACNCDHEMDHTPQNVGSRITMLKLKKARLETQVAYTRTRLLLAEMELQLAEKELHHEVKKTTSSNTPTRPQRKRPHKLVKLLSRVFKSSNQNTEDHTIEKRKKLEETEERNEIKKSADESQEKENRNTSRMNTQENRQERTDLSKKSRKDKSKNTCEKQKKTETKIKEKKSTEKIKGDKKHTISKDSKTKHSRRHKYERSKEKDNNVKADKELKSILKKTSIIEETNNNVPEKISTDVRGINEDCVEFNKRTIFFSPGHSSNSYSYEMDTTKVDKALDAIAEVPENIFIKKEVMEPILKENKGIVVDGMLSQNDQLFIELRENEERQEASSLGSMETLVLDEESEDRKF